MTTALVISVSEEFYRTAKEIINIHGLSTMWLAPENMTTELFVEHSFALVIGDAAILPAFHQETSRLFWTRSPEATYLVVDQRPQASKEKRGGPFTRIGLEYLCGLASKEVALHLDMTLKPGHALPLPRILAVEPLKTPRALLCGTLEKFHLQAQGLASGAKALAILEDTPREVSLIITELKTSDISGIEMVRRIRANESLRHFPIIILSAHGTAQALWECLSAGATGFLVKPPKRKLLVSEIGRGRRVWAGLEDPRLVPEEDGDFVKTLMQQQGFSV